MGSADAHAQAWLDNISMGSLEPSPSVATSSASAWTKASPGILTESINPPHRLPNQHDGISHQAHLLPTSQVT